VALPFARQAECLVLREHVLFIFPYR
jgi:hypothetical protein